MTAGWIRNTLDLSVMAITENVLQRLAGDPRIEALSAPGMLEFDSRGDLVDWLA